MKNLGISLQGGSSLNIALNAGFGIIMFISVANATAPTAISREGESIFISKYLPISYRVQILSKVLSAFILNIVGLIVLVIFSAILIKPPVYLIMIIVVVGVLGIIFTCFSGILIDLNFPKLHWENEQKAVKQNMNVLVNMVVGAAIAGLSIFLIIKLGLGLWTAFGVLTAIFAILDIVLYKVICTVGVRLFGNIEG